MTDMIAPSTAAAATAMADASIVLRLNGVSKRYGAVQANDDVSLEVNSGEIHALVGENGSGKSTLLGVASGTVTPDAGTIEIDGELLTSASPVRAKHLGLGMAYQTMSEVAGLSVAENLYLAAPADRRPAFGRMFEWAQSRLDEHELDVRAVTASHTLTPAKRQMLEVVQALLSEPRVLLLDEPTTALSHIDVDRLHSLIRSLASDGLGVVYVSHRLPEVLEVADRVTILRDGIGKGTYRASETTEADVVALMIGRPLEHAFPDRGAGSRSEAVIEIERLRGRRFGPIDLVVNAGEIVGIAGAEGNGQREFLQSLSGIEPSNGDAVCDGRRVTLGTPAGPLRAGIVYLSADRKEESVFTALGVRPNATLQVLRRFGRLGYVWRRAERTPVHELVQRLRLKAASIDQPVGYLSGGNQQKVALMRPFMKANVHLVVADEPTQGVDVGARLDIYTALRQKAAEGSGVIIKSGDAIELAGLCDRVAVMSRGRIVDELTGDELTEANIIAAIVGKASAHEGTLDG